MRIIADVSMNFKTLDDIIKIVNTVKADYIKLQWYSERDLYSSGSDETKLKYEWLPKIEAACKLNRKKLMCTVFNPDRVNAINGFVYIHKVASSEITDEKLMYALKSCGRPVIVSTGGADNNQIRNAVSIFGTLLTCLMACDVEYPAKRHNIRHMMKLKYEFPNINVGYSDHSIDICTMPILVSHYGGTFYEKHVKPYDDPEFEAHALTLDEFNEMFEVMAGAKDPQVKNPHQRIYNEELKRWVRPRVVNK